MGGRDTLSLPTGSARSPGAMLRIRLHRCFIRGMKAKGGWGQVSGLLDSKRGKMSRFFVIGVKSPDTGGILPLRPPVDIGADRVFSA